jgi:hypothetical protein
VLYIKGKEISSLQSIKQNVFSNNYGVFVFRDNQDGRKMEFLLMAGRVKNLRFIRE